VAISIFDLFTIGIGPSSSHTVGPMRAARRFALALEREGVLEATARVTVELFGSLGATGKGHGSDKAILVGLEGDQPETVPPEQLPARVERIRVEETLRLLGRHEITLRPSENLVFHSLRSLPKHPNGMRFSAFDAAGNEILERRY
jgi:L-serine dehydratase